MGPAEILANWTLLLAAPNVQGCLLPPFHNAYWFGLFSEGDPKAVNSWAWLNKSPKPSPATYTHWGTFRPGAQAQDSDGVACDVPSQGSKCRARCAKITRPSAPTMHAAATAAHR